MIRPRRRAAGFDAVLGMDRVLTNPGVNDLLAVHARVVTRRQRHITDRIEVGARQWVGATEKIRHVAVIARREQHAHREG